MNKKKDYKGYQAKDENKVKLSTYIVTRDLDAFYATTPGKTPPIAPTNKTASITQNKRFK
jgi:hypothetical protein